MRAMEPGQANGMTMDAERLLNEAARTVDNGGGCALATVADLFLPAEARLNDRQRGTMIRLLTKLVQAIEQDLRRRFINHVGGNIPDELVDMIASDQIEIISPLLFRSGLLEDTELVALLKRRTEEHRLVRTLRLKAVRDAGEAGAMPPAPLLDRLLESSEVRIAEAAMALLIAESRRHDRFQEPLLARTDLPAEIQHRMVWWSAAAFREHLRRQASVEAAFIDRALVAAGNDALAAHDESEALESRALQLARLLADCGKLDDELIVKALDDARPMLAIAGLSIRAGIDFVSTWEMAMAPARLTVLLRAIGMERASAISVLFALHQDGDAPDRLIDLAAAYEALEGRQAQNAIGPWKLDSFYRKAIAELAGGLGGRGSGR